MSFLIKICLNLYFFAPLQEYQRVSGFIFFCLLSRQKKYYDNTKRETTISNFKQYFLTFENAEKLGNKLWFRSFSTIACYFPTWLDYSTPAFDAIKTENPTQREKGKIAYCSQLSILMHPTESQNPKRKFAFELSVRFFFATTFYGSVGTKSLISAAWIKWLT